MAVLPLLAAAQDVPPKVVLQLEKATAKPGETIKGTLTATFAPGLHGYQNPPSKDYMLPVKVSAGEGTTLKGVQYPAGHMEMAGGEEAAVYSGAVGFAVTVVVPDKPGVHKVALKFFYQQCDEHACYMPTTIDVSAEITVAGDVAPSIDIKTARKAPREAKFELVLPEGPFVAGQQSNYTIKVTPGSGLFLFVKEPANDDFQINGDIVRPDRLGFDRAEVAGTLGWKYKGTFDLFYYFVAPEEPGKHDLDVLIEYLQADDKGAFLPQTKTMRFTIDVEAPTEPTTTETTNPGTKASPPTTEAATQSGTNDGLLGFLNNALEKGNWALIIPAALLAGLALCLTPCVFPMIPVTVTFFSNQGSKTTGGRFMLGLFYALGITVTYGAVGGISAAAGGAVGQLFTKPWFVIALALLLVALALSMFDVYEIRLPGFISKNLKGRSGPVGALIMGLLMGFAAAPCAGALVGAVAVKVAEIGSIPTGLGMFGLIGLGMGLPFMALATASSGAKAMPKSGGWLKTTKAVLGLLVLYFAFDYLFKGIGLRTGEPTTNYTWIAIFLAFIVYLLFFEKSEASKPVVAIKGLAAAGIGIFAGMTYANMGSSSTAELNWIPYNEQTFAQAVASGKPIMIDGKADWCVQCREIEHGVFLTPDGTAALQGVYLMAIDWSTGVPQDYIDATKKRFNIVGLPHIVFMEPGGKNEFAVKDIKTVDELKAHLRKAGANP